MRIPLSEYILFEEVLRNHAEQVVRVFGTGQGEGSS